MLAYDKDPATGIVRHLDDQCIGCNYCVLKCPYDVPKYNPKRGIVRKCDLCQGRLSAGEAPACAQACPTHAIRIVTVKVDLRAGVRPRADTAAFLAAAPDPAYTQPTTRYRSRRGLPPGLVAADAGSLRPQPAHAPLVLLTTLMGWAVGCSVVAALAPAGLRGAGPVAVVGALAGLAGLVASVFHLGQPLRAWRVFLGLRRSWLSREAVVFAAWLAAAAAALLRPALLPVAALFGVAGLYCSAMVYVDTRREFWRLGQSATRFFGTGAILGLATALAFVPTSLRLALARRRHGSQARLRGVGAPGARPRHGGGAPDRAAPRRPPPRDRPPAARARPRRRRGAARSPRRPGGAACGGRDRPRARAPGRIRRAHPLLPRRGRAQDARGGWRMTRALRRLLRARTGSMTAELVLHPGDFGLGRVPARLAPAATVDVVCGFCSTGCSLKVHVDAHGQALNLTPDPGYPVNLGMACPKGWESLAPLAAADRATTPLLRDGRGHLAPVDWERALLVFCGKFKEIQARHGAAAVAFLGTGQIVTEEMAFLGALAKFGMGMVHGDGNTRQCMATAVTAYKESFGFDAPPYTYADFEESDVIVLWGANLCIAHPILWQRVMRNRRRPEIIVVDPRRTETAQAATQHYALRPKSDLTPPLLTGSRDN